MKFPILALLTGVLAFGGAQAQDEIYDEPESTPPAVSDDDQPPEKVERSTRGSDRNIIYWSPRRGEFGEADLARDCYSLESEIAALTPLTYSYKPGFYEDFYHGVAINTGVWPVFIVTGVAEYRERKRMHLTGKRIEALRKLKARKRCFES